MALIPESRAALLEGLNLPDAVLYERLRNVQQELEAHNREAAVAAIGAMEAEAPGHWLTLTARSATASYDSNTPALAD